jgi:hypothetical protein
MIRKNLYDLWVSDMMRILTRTATTQSSIGALHTLPSIEAGAPGPNGNANRTQRGGAAGGEDRLATRNDGGIEACWGPGLSVGLGRRAHWKRSTSRRNWVCRAGLKPGDRAVHSRNMDGGAIAARPSDTELLPPTET